MGDLAQLLLYTLLLSSIGTSTSLDTISPGQAIKEGDTVISNGQSFELGFFSPGDSTRRYLGIWYKKLPYRTVVWVANRETPLLDMSGVLTLTDQGLLVLLNSTNHTIWSSKGTTTSKNPIAQLLDSGNLVVRDASESKPDDYQWYSFDYPTNNLLPGMKLGVDFVTGFERFLTSWKNFYDPARGDYIFAIDPRGFPQLVVKKGDKLLYRFGPWNGDRFAGAPKQRPNPVYIYDFVLNEKEAYYHFTLANASVPSRIVMNESGSEQRWIWRDSTNSWVVYYVFDQDQCDTYATCGANAVCNINNYAVCSCLEGFEPNSERDWILQEWSGGCVRKAPLGCNKGEGFVKYEGLKLPDTSSSRYDRNMTLNQCEELCMRNCSCTAYTNTDIRGRGSGCLLWYGDLVDMREYTNTGQDVFIRMDASYLEYIKRKRKLRMRKKIGIIVSSIILFTGVLALGFIVYIRKRKLKNKDEMKRIIEMYYDTQRREDVDLPMVDLTIIVKATGNFSSQNMLGKGGFGSVFKGTLSDGQEIAVKRFSMNSGQGLEEFINEVILIAKLQHRNLVNLLGCCFERDERMLIYEFMPNKSLDHFIFDQSKSRILDWQKRINIIDGIARGLLYLHQDSRLRIIHRDIKASNILLDNEMKPKISDFGLARIFAGNEREANTNRIVGTYGYIAPEYAADGLFSVKSDVFSFGVLVLEIVSGKKNRGFLSHCRHHNLLGHAWKLWMEGRPLELMDDGLCESHASYEVVRCINVGLLCVQQRPEDRPDMSNVVLMLSGQSLLPEPMQPGFFAERNEIESMSSSRSHKFVSTNEVSVTKLAPR